MRVGSRQFDFTVPVIMGIVNVTPDSFSDGGHFHHPKNAVEHALKLIEDGADILDIGGESTRPGAKFVPAAQEIERILPVIERIRELSDIPISVDTRKTAVAAAAIDAGADMVNDISAGTHDPDMFDLAAGRGVPLCLMHMRGDPETMQLNTAYKDVLLEIVHFLRCRVEVAENAGVDPDKIMIDPGIGFGKSAEDNVHILLNIDILKELNKPILIGTSRKSFIGKILGYEVDNRLEPTLATLSKTYENGARIFRVHDVAPAKRYLSMVQLLNNPD